MHALPPCSARGTAGVQHPAMAQDWHGNAITSESLFQPFVSAEVRDSAAALVATCTDWSLAPGATAWQCTVPGAAVTTAGAYDLQLVSSGPEATGWAGEAYEAVVTVHANSMIDVALTAGALVLDPASAELVAGALPRCICRLNDESASCNLPTTQGT